MIRAVSLLPPSIDVDVDVVVTVVVVTTLEAPLESKPELVSSGFSTLSSVSFVAFALSSNPAIVAVSKRWTTDLSYELSACWRHKLLI
jgi:hypothetical protein